MFSNKFIVFLFLTYFSFSNSVFSQDTTQHKKKLSDVISLTGYVKYLQTLNIQKNDQLFIDNLLHNRINLKAYLKPNLTAELQIRNRLFYGDQVRIIPNYGDLIKQDPGFLNMSALLISNKSFVLHSIADRAFIDYTQGKWNFRLGRQRINWGLNLVWNPNDIFNAYNFLDFDYEERPGSDALRVRYFYKSLNEIEFAFKPGRNADEYIAAALWKINLKGYDFQWLAGLYKNDIVIGTGWAGNIKNAGFKGEVSAFQNKNKLLDTTIHISASISSDYVFANGLYLNGSILYNSGAIKSLNPTQAALFMGEISAKNLMPATWSYFIQATKELNPIWNAGISTIWAPSAEVFFIMPQISHSIKENWDLDLIGQLFYSTDLGKLNPLGNYVFLRLKYSY